MDAKHEYAKAKAIMKSLVAHAQSQIGNAQVELYEIIDDGGLVMTGTRPIDSARKRDRLWVVNREDNIISKIGQQTNEIINFHVGKGLWANLYDGDFLWVTSEVANTV